MSDWGTYGGGGGGTGGGGASPWAPVPRKKDEKDDEDKSEEEKEEEAKTNLARYLGRLRGLGHSGDEKAQAKFQQYLWQYGDVLDGDELEKYGVTRDDQERFSSAGKISEGSWQETAVGGAGRVASILDRPLQGFLGGIRAFNAQKDAIQGWAMGEGYTSQTEATGETMNPWKAMYRGYAGKTHLNFREAMLQDPEAGGTAGDVADFAATMVIDPLNYVSFGAGSVAKGGLRALAKKGAIELAEAGAEAGAREAATVTGRELAQAATTRGWSKAEKEAARKLLSETVEEGSRGAGRGGILKQHLEDLVPGIRGPGATPAERFGTRMSTEIARRGRGGLVVGGRTVPGTGNQLASRALRGAGLPAWNDLLRTTKADLTNGNLPVQNAADAYAQARQGRGLRVVGDEVPKFSVAEPDALESGVIDQFAYITAPKEKGGMGIAVTFVDDAPYKSTDEMFADVAQNSTLKVQKGAANEARAAGLADEVSDQFTAARQVFGNVLAGTSDDAVAAAYHGQMFSPEAMRLVGTSGVGKAAKAATTARAGAQAADATTEQGRAGASAASAAASDLPPIPEGHTRLYRGEQDTAQQGGTMFTSELTEAQNHAGGDGQVLWVDVPNEVAVAGKETAERAGNRGAQNAAVEVPPDLAAQAQAHSRGGGKVIDLDAELESLNDDWAQAAGVQEGAEEVADVLADAATPGRGPLGEAIAAARAATTQTGRERATNKAQRFLQPIQRRAERARIRAAEAQGALDDLRADLSAQLDGAPGTKNFGQGKRLGAAGKEADDAAAVEVKASARAAGHRRRVELLEQRLAKVEEQASGQTDELIDTTEAGGKPGFAPGRRLGRVEGRRRALGDALAQARQEAAAAEEAGHAAGEQAWAAQQRYATVLAEVEQGVGATKAKATFGMGKRVEKAERAARDAARADADAAWEWAEAERAVRASGPDVKAAIDRSADKAAKKALADTGDKLLPKDTLGRSGTSATGATPLVRTELVKKGVRRRLLEGGFSGPASPLNIAHRVNEAVNTRARLRMRVGEGTRLAGEQADLGSQVAAVYENLAAPLIKRLDFLVRKGKVSVPTQRAMYDALEAGPEAIADLKPTLKPMEADLLTEMDAARHQFTELLVAEGVTDEGILAGVDTYMLRLMTDEGKKALRDVAMPGGEPPPPGVLGSRRGSDLAQGGSLERRKVLEDATLAELEASPDVARLKADRGVAWDAELYQRNPVISTAARAATAFGAVAEARLYRGMANIVTDAGEPLIVVASRGDKAARLTAKARAERLGYKAMPLSDAADVVAWAPDDVAQELGRMRDVVFNDDSIEAWTNFVDKWMRVWKSSATVPITSGFGFITRNVMGNMFNNFVKGVTDPLTYAEAIRLQALEWRAGRLQAQEGIDWDTAIDRLLAEQKVAQDPAEGARRIFTGRGREKAMLKKAREHGVFSQGFYTADLDDDVMGRLVNTTNWKRWGQSMNPLSRHGFAVRGGSALNQFAEHNARMAHFIDKFDKMGNSIDAARSVKETLFDYSDLTAFERNKLKRINGFYTWTRKNVPLQFRMLKESPGRVHRVQMVEEQFLQSEGVEGERPRGALSAYALSAGQGPVAENAPGFLKDAGGKYGLLVGVETPLEAAVETVLPVVQLAAMATPGDQRTLEPGGGQGNYLDRFQEIGRGTLGWTAGGPAEAIDTLYGIITGTDSFTGAPSVDAAGNIKRDKEEFFMGLFNVVAPGASKSKALYEGLTDSGKFRDSPTDMTRATLIRTLVGLQLTPQDAKTSKGELWRRYYEMQNAINEAFPDGIPTLDEMREEEGKYGVPAREGSGKSAFTVGAGGSPWG